MSYSFSASGRKADVMRVANDEFDRIAAFGAPEDVEALKLHIAAVVNLVGAGTNEIAVSASGHLGTDGTGTGVVNFSILAPAAPEPTPSVDAAPPSPADAAPNAAPTPDASAPAPDAPSDAPPEVVTDPGTIAEALTDTTDAAPISAAPATDPATNPTSNDGPTDAVPATDAPAPAPAALGSFLDRNGQTLAVGDTVTVTVDGEPMAATVTALSAEADHDAVAVEPAAAEGFWLKAGDLEKA